MTLLNDPAPVKDVADKCIDCGKCVSRCLFLTRRGSPGELARKALESDTAAESLAVDSYDCSLCSLCASVCPAGCNPSAMFIELRNLAQERQLLGLEAYAPLLKYEDAGRKFPFSGQRIPNGCRTVFFPGCTLPGLFPQATLNAYKSLQQEEKELGLVLNCCSKPSISLGIQENQSQRLTPLINSIAASGVEEVLTACPNCYMTLASANPPFKVGTIYSRLARCNIPTQNRKGTQVTIHDPCVTRFETGLHDDIRRILKKSGIDIHETRRNRTKTICCGEGGAVGFINSSLSDNWRQTRSADLAATDVPAATYCAGCANFLSEEIRITHVLNLLFADKPFLPAKGFPANYLSRLTLKLHCRA